MKPLILALQIQKILDPKQAVAKFPRRYNNGNYEVVRVPTEAKTGVPRANDHTQKFCFASPGWWDAEKAAGFVKTGARRSN